MMAGERAPPRDGRRGCCVFSEDFNESSGALRSPAGDEVEEHFEASSAARAFRAAFVHFVRLWTRARLTELDSVVLPGTVRMNLPRVGADTSYSRLTVLISACKCCHLGSASRL